jgi:hypothetical protein
MLDSLSKRRMVENQLYFRRPNQKVAGGFAELKKVAKDQDDKELLKDADPIINFFCECSDEDCMKKIRLRPGKYRELHKNKSQFTIKPGHNVPEIERIVMSRKNYIIVEKYNAPETEVKKPRSTNLDNS